MRPTALAVLVLALSHHPLHADESLNRARATLRRMQSVSTAIEAYMTDTNKAPEATSVEALVPLLVPTYIRDLPLEDGWDTPLRYVRTGAQSFQMVSAGADRKFDEKSWSVRAQTKDLKADALFTAGAFARIWTDSSGQPLALSEEEAAAAVQPYVDAEMAKMKAMSPEQSMSYFRTSSTNLRLDALMSSLEAYKRKHRRYPLAGSMKELEQALFPEFASEVPAKDLWGTQLRYVSSKDGSSYRLVSAGADEAFDEASWPKGHGALATDDEDAVVESGKPVRYWDESTRPGAGPEGAARKAMKPAARTSLERADARAAAQDYAEALEAYMEAVKADRTAADLERLRRYAPPAAGYRATEVSTATDTAAEERIAKARGPYIAALRQFFDLHPGDLNAIGDLVVVLDPKEAETLLTSLIQSRPRDVDVIAMRATMRAKAGQHLPALEDFEKARDLDAGNAERHYTAGVMAYEVATKAAGVTAKQKEELIRRGLVSLERAGELREGYFEALVYRSLLLREQAALTRDSAAKAKLIAEADALRERAKAMIAAKRESAGAAPAEAPAETPAEAPAGPLRVGDGVKAPVIEDRVAPIYPEAAKPHRISGIVIVEVVVDKSGRVTDARLLKGLPHGVGEAALEAVRKWTFQPGTLNGEPVEVLYNLTVRMEP